MSEPTVEELMRMLRTRIEFAGALDPRGGAMQGDREILAALERLQRELDALAKRLDIVDLPSGSPGDGGWVSSSRTRQRIGAVVDRIGGPGLDDDILDAVAEMIEQAERERDEALREFGAGRQMALRVSEGAIDQEIAHKTREIRRERDAFAKAWDELRSEVQGRSKNFSRTDIGDACRAHLRKVVRKMDDLDPRKAKTPEP